MSDSIYRDADVFRDRNDYNKPPRKFTAKEYIEKRLDGNDYERGYVETAQAQATNASEALGRLVEVLFSKGEVTEAEVYYIADGYWP